jgi:hypothetical protein
MSPQQTGLVCPRCRTVGAEPLGESPIAGVWTVYGCTVCFYTWRSTEPAENTDPDKYPAVFRLKPEEFKSYPVIPTIPPLRGK